MDLGQCTFTQPDNAWNASATDNCTVSSITYALTGATTGTGTTLNGVGFNFGVTTVTWTATDNSSNTATCSYTVTVADNQVPTITCDSDQPFNTDAGVCTYTQPDASLDPITADNCPTILTYVLTGVTTGSGSNTLAGVEFNTGITTITWTLDDSHGNTVTCSHQITVSDVELPLITQCGPGLNTTVSADPGVCNYTNSGTTWDATATDNCGIATIEYDLSGATTLSGSTTLDGVVFNLGTTTVLWTVTDVNGNITTCTYDIIVNDTELPIITCNQTTNLTLPADAGGCTYLNSGTGWDASATDNCGVASVIYTLTGATTGSGTTLNGVVFTGLTTVTWTATDVNGNTSTCSFDVLIEDTQVPTISCATNQTVVADAGVCTYTNSGTTWDATGTDNCTISFAYTLSGVTTGTGASLDGVSFNLGLTTVLWTVTDGAGNSATCSFTVTVNDTENPIITCAADQAVNADAGVCTYAHSGTSWDPIASDNCSQTVTYVMSGATAGNGGASIDGVVFNGGITTISWTTTDGAGNTATCTQIVEVDDTENPVITNCGLDANQTVIADAGVCTYTHAGNTWDAQATDNCNVSSITYSLTGATSGSGATLDGQVFNLGITTVTWTVMDDSLNSVTCTYDVTVNDTELPVITTCGPGSNQTVSADNGVCSYTHSGSAWDALATDNCSVASIVYTITGATNDSGTTLDGVTFNSGLSTVVWTVTDGSGNISTCTFDVTVEDNENPVVTSCGGNTIENVISDAGVCTYTHSGITWDATGTDNCAVATILADLSGASTGIALTTLDAVVFNLGNTIVTWSITDLAGNSSTCSFTVVVQDTENPVITCVPDPSVNTDAGVCTYTVVGTTLDATSTDNCSSTVSYSISGVTSGNGTSLDGVVFNLGVSTVTWTATDGAGNTDVCTQTITVTDAELPVVNCQTAQTVSTDPNVCTYTHTGTAWDATGSDNCSVSYAYDLTGVTTGTGTSLGGVTFNLGTTTVTWTATDGSGNTTTCSFDVTVNDTQAPAFTNCGNGTNPTVLANAGVCTFTYTATGWNSAATDNCTLASVVYDLSGVTTGTGTSLTGVVFNLGETTVTWTATDAAGNSSTCSYTVTVNELEAPVITTCGVTTSVDVVADPGVCTYTNVGSTWDALATDNCIISSIAYTLTGSTTGTGLTTLDGVAFSTGTTNVLWTVTDGSGNTATCQYTVNVTDDQAPVIAAVLPDLTVECSPTAPEAVDNCGPVTGVSDFTTYSGDTVVVVTWTFTDASGNTATAVQTITYDDVTAPVIPSIPDAIAQCDTTISAITTTDVCMGTIVGTTTDPLTYTSQGNYTVTWTFNDGNGNTSTATQNVIILDVTDPTISAPPTVNVYPNNAGCTAIIPDLGTPVTTDNCQVVSVTNDGPATYPLGATTVTWTVTDIGGNTTTATQTVNVLPLTSTLDTVACDVYISPDGIDLTPFGSGTYTAVIPGSFGCDSTITINLTLNQSSSSTITLAACDLYTAPDGAIYNNSGVYTAIIPNAAGCDSTITINLTIDSIETADVVMNDMVLTALQATDVTYQWVSCDNGYSPISGATQQSFDVLQYPLPSGDYAVILTNNTCVDTSECVNISIETIIPQLVTPNGDGSNDVFEIQGVYDYPNNILEIYNRWGNLVYRQESYQNNWGGECTEGLTLGGDILPTGTYFFIFDKGLNDGNKPVKGYIFLTK
jgi:gliding motility-associated-like protein